MTEKELRKLNRYQLLELIIMQAEELEKVKAQLAEAQQQLEQRSIQNENAGSIAQAALQLSGIFEAAQAAADIYLENVKRQYGPKEQTPPTEDSPQTDSMVELVDSIISDCEK